MYTPFVLNQSRLRDYLNCRRYYGWAYYLGLVPPGRVPALDIGSAVHEGLAILMAPGDEPPEEKLEKAVKASRDFFQKDKVLSAFSPTAEQEEMAERLIRGYFARYQDTDQLWAPLGQEISICVEVEVGWWRHLFSGLGDGSPWTPNPSGIFLAGRTDNLSTIQGGLWIVDYKTAGRMDPRDMLRYEMDIQLTAYIYGLSKQLTQNEGTPTEVKGAIIDLLVKTKVPQYAQELFTRTPTEMEEFEKEFIQYGYEMAERHQLADSDPDNWKDHFPKNTDYCFKYGSPCKYRDLCVADTPTRRLAYVSRDPDYVSEAQAELTRKEPQK